jgi:antitoxin (DNA-binding transcriptional repressor) of toxin-antitoxin stability system
MVEQVSKSEFKAKALELFRRIETSGEPVVVTDHGRPKLEVRRYTAPETKRRTTEEILDELGRAVLFFDNATDPVGEEDWEALK